MRDKKGRFIKGCTSLRKTHGETKTKFYRTWQHLKQRCMNPDDRAFNNYGGRGIKCLWNTFEEFKNDMYKSYLKHIKRFGERNTTIERINNNGDYCIDNCKWATMKIQARNSRHNRLATFMGKTKCISEWAEEFNIPYFTLYARLVRYKWTAEKSFTTPIGK